MDRVGELRHVLSFETSRMGHCRDRPLTLRASDLALRPPWRSLDQTAAGAHTLRAGLYKPDVVLTWGWELGRACNRVRMWYLAIADLSRTHQIPSVSLRPCEFQLHGRPHLEP